MKTFLRKTLWFLFPFFIFFLIPVIILVGTGENFVHVDNVLTNKDPYLLGYAYNENNYRYIKWFNLNQSKNNVVALGSSRVLQFRQQMFNESFYNAGYAVYKIKDFKLFLESIPQANLPDFLIVGLDQWMFNPNWDNGKKQQKSMDWQKSFSLFPKGNEIYTDIHKDLWYGKYGIEVLKSPSTTIKRGLNARVNNKGVRNDGSMQYGSQIVKLLKDDSSANDYQFKDTYKRIIKGNRRFEYGDKISNHALKELNSLLKFCKKNDIEVVGFTPPFADAVYSKMLQSKKYGYLDSLAYKLNEIFQDNGFEFYNYPDMSSCNSLDNQCYDGFHGSETTYINILIDMLNKGSVLNKVASKEKLYSDLQNKKNRFIVY